ncbi:MAG: hypothetical protein JXR95_08960 [Deltaproteobacteria bacterium]|nr:hypothetical protein [Deltaproteobacteria bacterium]
MTKDPSSFDGYFGGGEGRKVTEGSKASSLEIAVVEDRYKTDTVSPVQDNVSIPLANKSSEVVEFQNSSVQPSPGIALTHDHQQIALAGNSGNNEEKIQAHTVENDPDEEKRKNELRNMVAGSFSARKKSTSLGSILSHSFFMYLLVGLVISSITGFVAGYIYSSSALKNQVTEIVSQKKIISNTAVMLKDQKRIDELTASEKSIRESIMFKTAMLWAAVSVISFGIYHRVIRR